MAAQKKFEEEAAARQKSVEEAAAAKKQIEKEADTLLLQMESKKALRSTMPSGVPPIHTPPPVLQENQVANTANVGNNGPGAGTANLPVQATMLVERCGVVCFPLPPPSFFFCSRELRYLWKGAAVCIYVCMHTCVHAYMHTLQLRHV